MRYLTPILAAALLVAIVPNTASGQGSALGLEAGLNISTLRIDDPSEPNLEVESRTGFLFGAFLECGGASWFSLKAEAVYSRNGARIKGDEPVEIDLDYIRVPVLVLARLGASDSGLRPTVFAGPQVSFETRCRLEGQQDGASQSLACDSDQLVDPFDTNLVEFGLVFGGGIQWPLGSFKAHADARYNLGLSNVNAGSNASVVGVNNRGWSFTFGVGKPLGK